MGLTNKTFDAYEQTLIRDIITTRISKRQKVPRSSPNRSRTKSTGRKQNLIFQIVKPAPGKESNHMKYNKNKEFSEIKRTLLREKEFLLSDEPKIWSGPQPVSMILNHSFSPSGRMELLIFIQIPLLVTPINGILQLPCRHFFHDQ